METAEDEIAALRADKDVKIDNEEEEAIKATAVKSTNGNQPLYTAESSARPNQIKSVPQNTPTQGSPNGSEPQSLIEVQTQSSMVNETQSTRYGVWEPNDITPPDEFYEPEADDEDAVSNSQSKSCRLNPPAICDPIPKDTPRRASGNATLLNNIRSSLPTQSDFQELNQHYKSSNNNTRAMVQHAAEATNTVMGMIGCRFGFQMPNDTHKRSAVDDEEPSPEAVAIKKAKQAKQDELDLLKLDLELAQMVEMIAKLTSANVPHEEAKKIAHEFLAGL
ncbi:hypothetical protein DFH28DRAFT_1080161 [Melampsora americana]|nr:hypothetical protein DFH28DRAFT_1080161 [Melampsora americana]